MSRTFEQQQGGGVWTWKIPTGKQNVGLVKIYFASNLVYAGIFSSTTGVLHPLVDIYSSSSVSLVLPNKIKASFGGSGFSGNECNMLAVSLL